MLRTKYLEALPVTIIHLVLSSWITCMHMLRANMYCTAYLLKILFSVWNTCYWLKDTSVFVNRCLKVRKYLLDFKYYHVQVPPRLINNYYLMFLSLMHAYLTYQTELEYKGIRASKKNSEKASPIQKHVF